MSTFKQSRPVLHACNKIWNEAKALSICFPRWHLAAHHYISVYGISIVVINVGSLQPAICSGDKMSYIIASKCCDLEMVLPCIFLKTCKAVREISTTRNFSFFAIYVSFLSLSSKLVQLLKSPPGEYKEMCWSLSLSHFILFSVCLLFAFLGYFLAMGFIAILS